MQQEKVNFEKNNSKVRDVSLSLLIFWGNFEKQNSSTYIQFFKCFTASSNRCIRSKKIFYEPLAKETEDGAKMYSDQTSLNKYGIFPIFNYFS